MRKYFWKIKLQFLISGLVFILAANPACRRSAGPAADEEPPGGPEFSLSNPNIDLSKPLEASQRPEDLALARRIDELIEKSEFANARWGVFVVSLNDGRIVCAREARKLFIPASIEKVVTSVVALDKLGPDFRWKTEAMGAKRIDAGTLAGDLVLYGAGEPDFDQTALDKLADVLRKQGLNRITGNIIGDDSYFTGDPIGEGWSWGELQWYYGAPASALTFNLNQVTVSVENGEAKLSPETDHVRITNRIGRPVPGEPESIGLKRGLGDNQIYLYGEGNDLRAKVAVENPALWAAKNLKSALEKRGVRIEGKPRSVDWMSSPKADPADLIKLASAESAPLRDIIRKMNKDSVNLYAELILRTLGKKFGETAPDVNPHAAKVRGDDSAGTSVIKKWLRDNGISADEVEIRDGSGLSRLDYVTPEVFGRVLIFAAQCQFAETFKNSLPIAGMDGTLRGRLANVRGKILAKTGSITYVNSLAGYAKNLRDEPFAFVLIVNNATRKSDTSNLIDQIATAFTN